jgi:hypothetical protein
VASIETLARYGNYLFGRFRPFDAFEIIQNHVRLRINRVWDENGVCGCNVEIIHTVEIFRVSVSVYCVSEGQITQPPPPVILSKVLIEKI